MDHTSALVGEVESLSFGNELPEVEEEQFDAASKQTASVGNDSKWKVIDQHIQDRIAFYRDDLANMEITNMDLAKVGERYLVCNLVSMELQALADKVRVTTEAVNDSKRKS